MADPQPTPQPQAPKKSVWKKIGNGVLQVVLFPLALFTGFSQD
jgi:hypothetical protein